MKVERTATREVARLIENAPQRPIVIVVQPPQPAEERATRVDRLARSLLICASVLISLGTMALFSIAATGSSMGATALGWGLVIGFALGAMAVILAAEHHLKGRR